MKTLKAELLHLPSIRITESSMPVLAAAVPTGMSEFAGHNTCFLLANKV